MGKVGGCSKLGSGEGKQDFRPEGREEERELWDSKLILLLAAIGYAIVVGNVWCFCTWTGRLFLSESYLEVGPIVLQPSLKRSK